MLLLRTSNTLEPIIMHDSTVLMRRKMISVTDANQQPGFMVPNITRHLDRENYATS